jgi:hypothetical protein
MSPSRFRPVHVARTGEFTLPISLRHAFPLFSPEGERAWVEDWDPVYLHPQHPSTDHGTVFRTAHGGEETLWLVLRYDPDRAMAEYGRFSPGSRLGTVQVTCQEEGPELTRVAVAYSLTALSPAGNAVLDALTPKKYDSMLAEWRTLILHSQGIDDAIHPVP